MLSALSYGLHAVSYLTVAGFERFLGATLQNWPYPSGPEHVYLRRFLLDRVPRTPVVDGASMPTLVLPTWVHNARGGDRANNNNRYTFGDLGVDFGQMERGVHMELCELQQLAATARSEACVELQYADEQSMPADHESTMCSITGSVAGGTPSTALRLSNGDAVGPSFDDNEVEDWVWRPQKGMQGYIVFRLRDDRAWWVIPREKLAVERLAGENLRSTRQKSYDCLILAGFETTGSSVTKRRGVHLSVRCSSELQVDAKFSEGEPAAPTSAQSRADTHPGVLREVINSLLVSGRPVAFDSPKLNWPSHEAAVIDEIADLGSGTMRLMLRGASAPIAVPKTVASALRTAIAADQSAAGGLEQLTGCLMVRPQIAGGGMKKCYARWSNGNQEPIMAVVFSGEVSKRRVAAGLQAFVTNDLSKGQEKALRHEIECNIADPVRRERFRRCHWVQDHVESTEPGH